MTLNELAIKYAESFTRQTIATYGTAAFSDNVHIEDLPMVTRGRNSLFRNGVKTVGQARALSDAELLRIPEFGRVALLQLRQLIGKVELRP